MRRQKPIGYIVLGGPHKGRGAVKHIMGVDYGEPDKLILKDAGSNKIKLYAINEALGRRYIKINNTRFYEEQWLMG